MQVIDVLSSHFLFSACDPAVIAHAAAGFTIHVFHSGEIIRPLPPETNTSSCKMVRRDPRAPLYPPPFLCILTQGTAAVYTPGEGSDCLLRVLHAGDTFGVANLFSNTPPITRVVALKQTQALCMKEDALRTLIEEDSALGMRYIAFLSDRIRFLNRRLSCLGAGPAPRRLAAWLDMTAPEGENVFLLPLSMSRLADTLGLGRASLYRVMEQLTQEGYIRREGKEILFMDRSGMRTFYRLI